VNASDLAVRIKYTIVATLFCFIPLWIYIFADFVFTPDGFWQNLALAGLSVYFLGGIQLMLLLLYVYVVFGIWSRR